MIGILILSLSIILAGALPWCPYSASGRLRHHRPWDWLMDQNRLTGSVGVNDRAGLEGDPTAGQVEQLAAVLEAGRGCHGGELQGPFAAAGRDRLVAVEARAS
jgi:hypothetical protein